MQSLYDTSLSEFRVFLIPWKAYDLSDMLQEIPNYFKSPKDLCLLALPFSYIEPVQKHLQLPNLYLGATSMLSADPESFTGSIAAKILKEAGANFVFLGTHSSRKWHGESEASIRLKLKKAHEEHLKPFLFVGETYSERLENKSYECILGQLTSALQELNPEEIVKTTLVFEMPWIKKSLDNISKEFLQEHYSFYEKIVEEVVGKDLFSQVDIVYPLFDKMDSSDVLLISSKKRMFFAEGCKAMLGFMPQMSLKRKEDLQDLHLEPSKAAVSDMAPALKKVAKETDVMRQVTLSSLHEDEESEKEQETPFEAVEAESKQADRGIEKSKSHAEEEKIEEKNVEGNSGIEILLGQASKEEIFVDEAAVLEKNAPPPVELSRSSAMDNEIERMLQNALRPEALASDTLTLEKLAENISLLEKANENLKQTYEEMQALAERLFVMRKEFPFQLHYLTEELKALDPTLQTVINKAELSYFEVHPEKALEARVALEQLQQINGMIKDAAVIPQTIELLKSKGIKTRELLAELWSFFVKNRKELESRFPEFVMPALPSQLGLHEPVIDLSLPEVPFGQSPLLKKSIGIVKL